MVRSLYECGQGYDLILELVCPDVSTLHHGTELLADFGRNGGFGAAIGTTTFIVADSHDNLPLPTIAPTLVSGTSPGRLAAIRPIERKYIGPLDSVHRTRYESG